MNGEIPKPFLRRRPSISNRVRVPIPAQNRPIFTQAFLKPSKWAPNRGIRHISGSKINANRRYWMADLVSDGLKQVENERKACLGGQIEVSLRRISTWISRIHPDPLFMQNIQEFSIEQGVIWAETEAILGFVWEFWGNGGHAVPGLVTLLSAKKKRVFLVWVRGTAGPEKFAGNFFFFKMFWRIFFRS